MRHRLRHPVLAALAIGAAMLALAACGGSDDDDSATAGPASLVSVETVEGTDVLVDSGGRTLYTADVERGGRILCTDGCTSFWDPVGATADQARTASGDLDLDLATVKRPDGRRQLALDGQPLYTFTEEGAGELQGDGFTDDFEGTQFVWSAATAGGEPASTGSSGDSSPY